MAETIISISKKTVPTELEGAFPRRWVPDLHVTIKQKTSPQEYEISLEGIVGQHTPKFLKSLRERVFGKNPVLQYTVEVTGLQYTQGIPLLQESLPNGSSGWLLKAKEYQDSYMLVDRTATTTAFMNSIQVVITGSMPMSEDCFFKATFSYSLDSFNQAAGIQDPVVFLPGPCRYPWKR